MEQQKKKKVETCRACRRQTCIDTNNMSSSTCTRRVLANVDKITRKNALFFNFSK